MPLPSDFDTQALVATLSREYASAENYWEWLRDQQYLAFRYYEAKPFGNEVDGQSQVILPDVQETIDYMAISVLRTFASGDRVIEIEATDEEGEELADEATAAIGFNFMRQQDGYRILHDWTTSGLLEKVGVVKSMMVNEEKIVHDRVVITDPVQVELAGAELDGEPEQQPDGTFLASIRQSKMVRRSVDVTVPASEFRFSRLARNEDDSDYLAHVCLKTRSELVEMGFDRDQVYSLPAHTTLPDVYDEREQWVSSDSSPALEEVLFCEEYARIDIDGDGIAERVKVCRVEEQILRDAETKEPAVEPVEDQPFTVFCPFPKPHQMVGYSLADKVMDIQLFRSTIARQLMDGMRNANLPRPVVSENGSGENTIDDLLSPIAGAPIRVKDPNAVTPYQNNFDVGKSLNVMEWMTGERESRTGITRLNQGLDADALNKTASGTAMMQAQGQQQEEFIARNLAESFSRLVVKKYRMMRREGEPFKMKVDGQYRLVDPSKWPEEININIRVGLGTGSKDKRIQYRMTLVPLMAEGAAQGKVTDKNLFNMMNGLVRDMGLGQGDDFWKDPDAPPEIDPATGQPKQEPQKPDPEMAKVQADAQAAQQKAQLAEQESQQKLSLSQQESQTRMEIMHNEGQQKITLEATKAEQAQRLAEDKATFEANLARETADRNYQLALMQEQNRHALAMHSADHAHEIAKQRAAVPQERPGGRLDA